MNRALLKLVQQRRRMRTLQIVKGEPVFRCTGNRRQLLISGRSAASICPKRQYVYDAKWGTMNVYPVVARNDDPRREDLSSPSAPSRSVDVLTVRTHEDLLEQSRSQDLEIQDLLRQLDQMHTDSKIKYWISKAKSEAVKLQDRASLNITRKCPRLGLLLYITKN